MNWVDIVILALLVLGAVWGLRQGFLVQAAAVLGVVLGLVVARMDYTIVRHALGMVLPHGRWLTAISYLLVFLAVWVLVTGIARALRRGMRLLFLGGLDRLAGGLLGLVQGIVLVELLLFLGKRVPNADLHRAIKHSQLAPSFLHVVPYIDRFFPHV